MSSLGRQWWYEAVAKISTHHAVLKLDPADCRISYTRTLTLGIHCPCKFLLAGHNHASWQYLILHLVFLSHALIFQGVTKNLHNGVHG